MISIFAVKLAITNIKKNRKFYLPYAVAAIGIIMMFYIMIYLTLNTGIDSMQGTDSLRTVMAFGVIVIGIFATVFLFYTNSFLMKRRKKEIGLYNILGMEKKHITKILAIENIIISISVIIGGLISGILFSKLVFMILCKMIKMQIPIVFQVPPRAVIISVIVFAAIFFITLLSNMMSIRLAKPIELLRGSDVGEKEPKTKGIMAIIGALCLGLGYYIAITTKSPLDAILMFFIAVILVIVGTYLLFTAGSIAILKFLRKNKKFYYKAKNFTAVSGMIYRMKQNAVGLANICILSTMVLVMVSTTVSLFIGVNDVIDTQFAGDIDVAKYFSTTEEAVRCNMKADIEKLCREKGIDITKETDYISYSVTTSSSGRNVYEYNNSGNDAQNLDIFIVVPLSDYNRITGQRMNLKKDQVIVYNRGKSLAENFTFLGRSFRIKSNVDRFISLGDLNVYVNDTHLIVVSDTDVLDTLVKEQKKAVNSENTLSYSVAVDLNGTDAEKTDCYNAVASYLLSSDQNDGSLYYTCRNKLEGQNEYYSMIGGFFFLGVFLGLVFTFAAALIIYYKQISEGYYDKDKFEIMQKIGMSKKEVRRTIKTQVLMVFFIPLIMAGIHVLAAFKMITRLLILFSLTNVMLFAMCTLVTFIAFAIIYAIVYAVTAREYYKIVG